jgi:ubiquitin C-terminal hydrolase
MWDDLITCKPNLRELMVQACGHESHCFDACCDLSLSVVDPNECTLTDCLRQFTAEESLDVAYRCEQCTATTKKTKIMRLYTPPTVLIVHLKRFSRPGGDCGESGGGFFARQESFSRMRKNTARVDIPEQLHIVPFCNAARLAETGCRGTYELVAVSHHSGGMGGGHYTATGRAISDARWYCFNDSSVTRSKSPAYGSTSAYVLFYRMMHS